MRSGRTKIMNIAKSNQLAKYIHPKCVAPEEVDEFDKKAKEEDIQKWLEQQAGDANMQLAITYNCKPTPAQVVSTKKTAKEIWSALQY